MKIIDNLVNKLQTGVKNHLDYAAENHTLVGTLSPFKSQKSTEDLKGWEGVKQRLSGSQVRALVDAYHKEKDSGKRDDLLLKFRNADSIHAKHIYPAIGGTYLANIAAAQVTSNLVNKGVDKLISKGINAVSPSSEDDEDPENKYRTSEEIINKGVKNKVLKQVLSRLAHPDQTSKVALGDVTQAAFLPTNAKINKELLLKPGVARLLGATTFSHGTTNDGLKSILQSGLDPTYGGDASGSTAKIVSKAQDKFHLAREDYDRHADNISRDRGESPSTYSRNYLLKDWNAKKQFQQGPSTSIPSVTHFPNAMKSLLEFKGGDTSKITELPRKPVNDFMHNAIGQTYVARGGTGKAVAAAYSMLNNPNLGKEMGETFINTVFPNGVPNSPPNPLVMYAKVPKIYKATVNAIKDNIYNPDKSTLIAGVMPHKDFNSRFKNDSDDIFVGGSAYTTKATGKPSRDLGMSSMHPDYKQQLLSKINEEDLKPIDPKHLNVGSVSFKQILQNRSKGKDWLNYIKEDPKSFAAGVGLTGLSAAHAVTTAYPVYRTLRKILSGENAPAYAKAGLEKLRLADQAKEQLIPTV